MTEPEEQHVDFWLTNDRPADKHPESCRGEFPKDAIGDCMLNDQQLLKEYVQGNDRAFEMLIEKYFRLVHTLAARRLGDRHMAEEVAQSVFLLLSRKAHSINARSSVGGWLVKTTGFACRDAIKMRRRREENERKLAMSLPDRNEHDSMPSELGTLLDEAIQSLRPDEQAGIIARFFEGKDFQEIGDMFSITEDAARKRTARCLEKLRNLMVRRGANVELRGISGLLLAQQVHHAVVHQTVQAAIQMVQAISKGSIATENVTALAERIARRLRWRSLAKVSLRFLPVILCLIGVWTFIEWRQPPTIESLGRAWGALDRRVAEHRRFLMRTDPSTPNYHARVQKELAAISVESSRIVRELGPLLASSDGQTKMAQSLTADLAKTLNLDRSKRRFIESYINNRLTGYPSPKDAMIALAETTASETVDIKAMLSSKQQKVFDEVYGADGVLLFSYAKATARKEIGP